MGKSRGRCCKLLTASPLPDWMASIAALGENRSKREAISTQRNRLELSNLRTRVNRRTLQVAPAHARRRWQFGVPA